MSSPMSLIYCHKCKNKTKNVVSEIDQTNNGLYRIAAKFSICKTNKSQFIKASVEEVKPVVKEQLTIAEKEVEAKEIYSPVRKTFPKRKIITLGIDDLWAAILVVMTNFADQNDGYKYMLNVIDTFSKYSWSRPLKKKNGVDVTKAFEDIINDALMIGHRPSNVLHKITG